MARHIILLLLISTTVLGGETCPFGTIQRETTGEAVENAPIEYEEYGEKNRGMTKTTMTDDHGFFKFPDDDCKVGSVTVRIEGLRTTRKRWPSINGDQLQIDVGPAASLHGKIEGFEGHYARVQVIARSLLTSKLIQENGEFHFDDLTPGKVQLLIFTRRGYALSLHETTLEPGQNGMISFPAPSRTANIVGYVYDSNDQPVIGARLKVNYPEDDSGILKSYIEGYLRTRGRMPIEGWFLISNLIPNIPITIHAEHEGNLSESKELILDPDTTEQIILRFHN